MSRTKTLTAIDKKIEIKAAEVDKLHARCRNKEDELSKLMAAKERILADNIIKAYRKSRRSYDEVMEFLVCDNY